MAKEHSDLRRGMHESEQHIKEADSIKGLQVPEGAKMVALTRMLFEELRHQGPECEGFSYDALRSLMAGQAAICDDEKAAKGNPRSLEEGAAPAPEAQAPFKGACVKSRKGESVRLEPQQVNALFKGTDGDAGKGGAGHKGEKGQGKRGNGGEGGIVFCNWWYKFGHRRHGCEDMTKCFKERGIGRHAPGHKPRGGANTAEATGDKNEDREPTAPKWMNAADANKTDHKGQAGMFNAMEAGVDRVSLDEFVVQKKRQGPKDRGARRKQRVQSYESHNSLQELQDQGAAFCFTDPRCGRFKAIVEHEASNKGYEHVCALIGPGASGSVMAKYQCRGIPIRHNEGDKDLTFRIQEGRSSAMNVQAGEVNKAFGSVVEMVGVGNKVALQR